MRKISSKIKNEFLNIYVDWVYVLLNLKSVVNFKNDLRNHNFLKTWNENFIDN